METMRPWSVVARVKLRLWGGDGEASAQPLAGGPGTGIWVWARAPPGTKEPVHTRRAPGPASQVPLPSLWSLSLQMEKLRPKGTESG